VSLPLFDGYHSLSCTHPFSLLAIHELVTKPLSVNQHRLFLMHAHAHRIFSALRGRNHLQAHTMNKNDSATFIIHMIILAATVTHHHHPFIAASSQRSNCDPPDASSGTQCFTFCSLTSRHSEMSGLGFLSLFSTHCLLSRGLTIVDTARADLPPSGRSASTLNDPEDQPRAPDVLVHAAPCRGPTHTCTEVIHSRPPIPCAVNGRQSHGRGSRNVSHGSVVSRSLQPS